MTFRQAVDRTPSVRGHYQPGLKALSAGDAARIRCANSRRLTGSINVDGALRATDPNASRWDYGIGHRRGREEVAVWVEVHPASSVRIEPMLKKFRWLKDWLRSAAPALKALTKGDYYWVSTDASIWITPHSPQARRLAAVGLRGPLRALKLP